MINPFPLFLNTSYNLYIKIMSNTGGDKPLPYIFCLMNIGL